MFIDLKLVQNIISNAIEISRLHVGPSNEFKRNMINKISLLCCRKKQQHQRKEICSVPDG